jgi:anti-sigma factor RsiW
MTPCNGEQLLLYAAGELEAARAAELQRHLATCPACAAELGRLRQALGWLDGLPPLEPSGEALARILAAGRQALLRRRPAARPTVYRLRLAALAAAAVLALVVGWSLLWQRSPQGLTAGQFDELWNRTAGEIADTGNMAEDLAEQHAADPWTRATDSLVADLSRTDVAGQLLELDENLDVLEGFDGG